MKCFLLLPPKSSLHTSRICHTYWEIGACKVRFKLVLGLSEEGFSLHSSPISGSFLQASSLCGCRSKWVSLLPVHIMLFHYIIPLIILPPLTPSFLRTSSNNSSSLNFLRSGFLQNLYLRCLVLYFCCLVSVSLSDFKGLQGWEHYELNG